MNGRSLLRYVGSVLLGAVLTTSMPGRAGDEPREPRVGFVSGEARFGLLKSPDGKLTVQGKGTGVAQIVDAKTGKPAGPRLRHEEDFKVICWAFSRDGKLVATGAGRESEDRKDYYNNGEIRVWEIATGKLVAERRDNIGMVRDLAFTADGKVVRFRADRSEESGK